MRVVRRRRGLDGKSTHASGATHVIKIGFSTWEKNKRTGKEYKQPHKYPGFVILHDSIDEKNKPRLDVDGMERLGVTEADIALAREKELKAPDGTLPTDLHVIIQNDARRDDHGDWEYPGVFAESLECFTKDGVFCIGNGHKAMRRQEDGTKAEVDCVPEGAADTKPGDWCKYSIGKGPEKNMKCKSHSRLTVCVFVVGPDGIPVPLSESLGISARYRIDTHSDYNAIRIQETLDGAADQLDGHIGGITGVLKFARQTKRAPADSPVATATVGQISLHLSPEDIARQKARLGGWALEAPTERATPMLEGPAGIVIDPTETLADATKPASVGFIEDAEAILGEPETETEPEPEDDCPESDGPLIVSGDTVLQIEEYAEAAGIDIDDQLRQKGHDDINAIEADYAEKVLAWLKSKAGEGEGE